jgi:hypothetical protein
MICDSHCHLKHGDAEHTEYSPETIIETMDAAGIDRSIVFAMSTTAKRSIEMASEAARKFPDRLIPFAYALPSYERAVVDELEEAISHRGFRGLKIHLGECTVADYVIDPVMELAGRLGVPCLLDYLGRFGTAESLATRFPNTKQIVCHLGQYLGTNDQLIDRFIGLAERCPNVYLDTSGVVLLYKIQQAVARVGSERVLWGIDGPHMNPDLVSYARYSLDGIRMLKLAEADERNVLGGSIAKLIGM